MTLEEQIEKYNLIEFTGTEHFSPEELASPDIGKAYINPYLPVLLEILRINVGRPLRVSSGFRTWEHNKKVGGAPNSYHLRGMAVDIICSDDIAYDVLFNAVNSGFNGVGVSQKLGSNRNKRFIHLDIRSYQDRRIWSY